MLAIAIISLVAGVFFIWGSISEWKSYHSSRMLSAFLGCIAVGFLTLSGFCFHYDFQGKKERKEVPPQTLRVAIEKVSGSRDTIQVSIPPSAHLEIDQFERVPVLRWATEHDNEVIKYFVIDFWVVK